MRTFRILLLLGLLLGPGVPGLRAKDPAGSVTQWPELPATLQRLVAATRAPGSAWGVLVVHADSGAVWFATNSTRLFVPASNTKLFSVALALHRFGSDHRFATTLALAKPPDASGTLAGPLWVRGGGAPFSPAPSPAGTPSSDLLSALDPLVALLEKQGVRRLPEGLILDDAWFDSPPYGPGWNWDDLQEAYGAPVGAFVANDNSARVIVTPGNAAGQPATIDVEPVDSLFAVESNVTTTATNRPPHLTFLRRPGESRLRISGSVPVGVRRGEPLSVPDATLAFGLELQAALARREIRVDGPIRKASLNENPPGIPFGLVPSAPLGQLAADCLKPSNNLLAHLLWLQVGADLRRQPRPGEVPEGTDDAQRAANALATFLRPIGITGDEVFLEEGSGLSRKNLVSPLATVRLLRHARRQPWGPAYVAALPVGGVDGTLAGRFKEGPARGNVRAKTGSLRQVHALAGYVTTAGRQPLVFAVYVNGHQTAAEGVSARTEIDRLVTALAGFTGRGPE